MVKPSIKKAPHPVKMPLGKRKYGGTSYYSKKRRVSGYRRKIGYRKFASKAFGYRSKKPARFNFSRRANRLNTAVARTIRGMAETKIIALRQQDWTQPAATPTAPGVSTVKFITGSGAVAGYTGYSPVSGFAAPQGDGKNNRDGQFIWLKHTTAALTVQMDHLENVVSQRPSATKFRVIVFKAKRALNPLGQTTSPDTNLFLQNNGNNQGDSSTAVNAMNVMDMMLQPINTNSFYVLKDTQFTLQHTTDNSAANSAAIQTNFPSNKTIRLRLPHNAKARIPLNSTDEPIDYDYRFAVAVYAFYPNQSPTTAVDTPLAWSASIRGTTGFNDV